MCTNSIINQPVYHKGLTIQTPYCTDYLSCQQQLGEANLCLVHGNDPTCLWQLGKIMFGTTAGLESVQDF